MVHLHPDLKLHAMLQRLRDFLIHLFHQLNQRLSSFTQEKRKNKLPEIWHGLQQFYVPTSHELLDCQFIPK